MHHDSLLQRLSQDLAAKNAMKARVKRRVLQRIRQADMPLALSAMRKTIEPNAAQKQVVWERVYARITNPQVASVLDYIRAFLTPSAERREKLSQRVALRLVPQPVHAQWPMAFLKVTAAFALIALVVGLSPVLFIASPTVAESTVSLMPTRGEVSLSVGGLWQPVTGEITLEPGMMLRTHDGEASILFHDDGVVRMDANTTIQLHDTADRSEPAAPDVLPTLTLYTGRLWVQGLIPPQLRGLTVSTSYGQVTVNEGSVSVAEDSVVDVSVFNRRAVVTYDGHDIVLVAGERTQLWEGNVPLVKKVAEAKYDDVWSKQNLARDAVHRREIAQLQQELRAAQAGILPTSRLYPVKRAAETVDMLLTFSEEGRTQKRIEQAQRRLDEAAALITENQSQEAKNYLQEYRDMLQELARETQGSTITDFLLQRSLSETSAKVAAAQPEDDAYLLKLAVLEASTALDSSKNSEELEAVLLMDALTSLNNALDMGDTEKARADWVKLQPSLTLLDNDQLSPDIRKEVIALLGHFAVAAEAQGDAIADPDLLAQAREYLPTEEYTAQPVESLSEEQVQAIVKAIRSRIFIYHMQKSRLNQLALELKALEGNPEQGRILRQLYTELPGGPENFPDRIQKEITKLRWEKAGDVL